MSEPPELVVLDAEPPGADIVKLLEAYLKRAKRGEFSSIGLAWVTRDGFSGADWSEAPSVVRLIGAVSRLEYRLNRQLDED